MKACIFTLGCKVNEVESASVAAALKSWGAEVEERLCPADIYVLNTCAVTREAEKKSRQLVARARKYNNEAKIFVVGCASEKDSRSFEEKGVFYVGGARRKNELISVLAKELGREYAATNNEQDYEILPEPVGMRTRAFIKIEDGCNNFCSYCVIPYLRGRVRSRSAREILCEVNNTSCPEVVLTGINISAYNYGGTDLAGLITMMSGADKRIRLGSIECRVIDERFLSACRSLKNFAPQFHLSLQSGSDEVLRAMNRRYTRAQYLEKCALIYQYFPAAAITCDIIAGFPTETEQDFADSLSIIDEVGFARVHAFAFSPREGTAAFKMKDIPYAVKEERLQRLLAAAKLAEERYVLKFIGSTQSVIFEDMEGEYNVGYTPNYIKVWLLGDHSGEVLNVALTEPREGGALAVLAENSAKN